MTEQQLSPVHWQPIEGAWYRLRGTVCGLHCTYCAAGVYRRVVAPPPPPTAPERAQILRELEQILDATPAQQELHLTADDLLDFEDFEKILEAFKRHGRRLELITPGLRLSDAAFVEKLSAYDIHLTLTYLADTPATYLAMTGNPQAHARILRAIENLRFFGVPHLVNTVITRLNCGELHAIACRLFGEYDVPHLTAMAVYLEQGLLDVRARIATKVTHSWSMDGGDLFAPFAQVDEQLARIDGLCAQLGRRLAVVDIPLCQLRSEVAKSPRIHFNFTHHPGYVADHPTPHVRDAACAGCALDSRCCYIAKAYLNAYPQTTFRPLAQIDVVASPETCYTSASGASLER